MRLRNDRGAAPARSQKEALLPSIPEFPAKHWAHARAEDVNPEFMKQGPGWYALFNPGPERKLDVSLVRTLTYSRCVSSKPSTICANDSRFSIV